MVYCRGIKYSISKSRLFGKVKIILYIFELILNREEHPKSFIYRIPPISPNIKYLFELLHREIDMKNKKPFEGFDYGCL